MKCNVCGYENLDESIFCQECGKKFDEVTPVVAKSHFDEMVESEDVEVTEVNDAELETITAVESQSVTEIEPDQGPKKKSKLPILIVGLLIIAGLIGAGLIFGKELFKSDEEKLIEAIKNTQMSKQKAVIGEVGFDEFTIDGIGVMEAALVENIVKGLKIEYKIASDAIAYQVEGNVGIVMNGSELIDIIFHMNKEYVAIGIPALYEKTIYLNWNDIQDLMVKYELIEEDEMPELDVERVMELMDSYVKAIDVRNYKSYKNFDMAKYEEPLYGFLTDSIVGVSNDSLTTMIGNEEITTDGKLYTLDIKMDVYMDIIYDLMEMLVTDENVKPMLVEGVASVMDAAIAEKDVTLYNLFGSMLNGGEVAKEWNKDVEDGLLMMKEEAIASIESGYDEFITEFESAMDDADYEDTKTMVKEIYSEIAVESKMAVADGYVKSTETLITVNDSILDAISDNETLNSQYGYQLGALDEMDVLFNVVMYERANVLQIDEAITFDGLPSDAVDFASLNEEDMYEIYQEIMINAQTLSSSFSGGF